MTGIATAAAAAAAASAAGAGIQASSGKKAADAAAGGQLQGLGQATDVIRGAIGQYDPYRRGGGQAYRQMQRLYGFQPEGGDPDAPRALTAREKKRFAALQGRTNLTPAEQRELNKIQGIRNKRKAYGDDFDLARTVGQDEERKLLGLEEEFGKEEQGIFDRQEGALRDYTARNQGLDQQFKDRAGVLDTRFESDVAGLDKGYRDTTGTLDAAYYGEEKALRDKIAAGDVTIDPGYKFRVEQGKLQRDRDASSKGRLLSGGHLKDLEEFSQGLASQEFGAATGRLNDLYAMGQGNYQMRRGDITGDYQQARGYRTGDYERGRGYLTGDYERDRDYGTQDYGNLQNFLEQSLGQRRGRFDRRYGQGTDQRGFAIDRFNRRTGGAQALNQQGFDALGQQSNLSQTLAQLFGQAGQVQGQRAAAGPTAFGQFGGAVGNDLSTLALLYGLGGQGGRRTTPGAANRYWGGQY